MYTDYYPLENNLCRNKRRIKQFPNHHGQGDAAVYAKRVATGMNGCLMNGKRCMAKGEW